MAYNKKNGRNQVNPLIDAPAEKQKTKSKAAAPDKKKTKSKAAAPDKKKTLKQVNIDYTHEGDGMACVDGVFRGEDWSELDES